MAVDYSSVVDLSAVDSLAVNHLSGSNLHYKLKRTRETAEKRDSRVALGAWDRTQDLFRT